MISTLGVNRKSVVLWWNPVVWVVISMLSLVGVTFSNIIMISQNVMTFVRSFFIHLFISSKYQLLWKYHWTKTSVYVQSLSYCNFIVWKSKKYEQHLVIFSHYFCLKMSQDMTKSHLKSKMRSMAVNDKLCQPLLKHIRFQIVDF